MEPLPVGTAEDLSLGHPGHHTHLAEEAPPVGECKVSLRWEAEVMDGVPVTPGGRGMFQTLQKPAAPLSSPTGASGSVTNAP